MSSNKEYLPGKDADFDAFFNNLINYVDTKTSGDVPAWPTVPPEAAGALIAAYPPWHEAYVKAQGVHTVVDTEAKREERRAAVALIRPFVAQYLRFPPVTDTDRTAMNIPNRAANHTPKPAPSVVPEAEIRMPYPMVVEIRFRAEGSARWGKPAKVQGAKIVYALLDSPPATVEELTRSAFDTRSPFTLTFEENQRGKSLYFALRWENAKGQAGPWNVIQKAIVP
jgi:hypothetical protein